MDSLSLDMVGILLGGSPSATFGGDPVVALKQAERNTDQKIATEAKQPEVALAISRFTKAVGKATTVDQALADPAVTEVLLAANGLADQAQFPALVRKALTSDPANPKSLVNQLSDTRFKLVAQTFQFATKGLAILRDPKVMATLTQGYAEVKWRQSLDAATPGLSNALAFKDAAHGVTSIDQILGSSTLRTVVTTALGIPAQIAFQELPAQEKAISSRLDIRKLKDPTFVENFARRYLLANQRQSNASSGAQSLEQLSVSGTGLLV